MFLWFVWSKVLRSSSTLTDHMGSLASISQAANNAYFLMVFVSLIKVNGEGPFKLLKVLNIIIRYIIIIMKDNIYIDYELAIFVVLTACMYNDGSQKAH